MKGATRQNVSIDDQTKEVSVTEAPAESVAGAMVVGAKVSASSKGEYWITVDGTVTVGPDQSVDDAADALRRFVVSHRRALEAAFLAAS